MITNLKEIHKELSLAKKHFNHAVELAKRSLIVGEINFPQDKAKAGRPRGSTKKKNQEGGGSSAEGSEST